MNASTPNAASTVPGGTRVLGLPDPVVIRQLYLGCLSQASYLVGDRESGRAIAVDPRRDIEELLDAAEAEGLTIELVVETHFHADFLSGHLELADATGAEIAVGAPGATEFDSRALADGDVIDLGTVQVEVWSTPGHTPESISLLVRPAAGAEPAAVLTGDTLFIGDVGRPDLLVAIHDPERGGFTLVRKVDVAARRGERGEGDSQRKGEGAAIRLGHVCSGPVVDAGPARAGVGPGGRKQVTCRKASPPRGPNALSHCDFIATDAEVLWRRNDPTTARRLEQHQGLEIDRGAMGAQDPGHQLVRAARVAKRPRDGRPAVGVRGGAAAHLTPTRGHLPLDPGAGNGVAEPVEHDHGRCVLHDLLALSRLGHGAEGAEGVGQARHGGSGEHRRWRGLRLRHDQRCGDLIRAHLRAEHEVGGGAAGVVGESRIGLQPHTGRCRDDGEGDRVVDDRRPVLMHADYERLRKLLTHPSGLVVAVHDRERDTLGRGDRQGQVPTASDQRRQGETEKSLCKSHPGH